MSTKNIFIGVGILAVAYLAYNMWQKRNQTTIKEGSFNIIVEEDKK